MNKTPDKTSLACVILAAGEGTRMRSKLPKVLHPVAGMPMIKHVIAACAEISPEKIVAVIAPDGKAVEQTIAPVTCAVQAKPLGTGDAVKAAREALKDFKGDIIVLFGDTPLITSEALQSLRDKRRETKAAIVVSGFTPEDPALYGRLVQNAEGHLTEIVETRDATPDQKKIKLCNGGIMLFDAEKLWPLLDRVRDNNIKKEFYLTDCVKLAREQSWPCAIATMPVEATLGINTRIELAETEKLMQERLRRKAMLAGVTMIDPSSVFLSADTQLGKDVTIHPNVIFGPGVSVADGVEIRSFCHLEQTAIQAGAIIGPFARLRPKSVIGEGARIGNFVEIKNTEIGAGAKVNHLTYLGDASVGGKTNVGAGTITCNYDGNRKLRTEIGAGAFIGSNSCLVAPVTVGSGAYIGAGSVITENVAPDALSVTRGKQTNIPDWARRRREATDKESKD